MYISQHGDQNRILDPVELELEVVVSHPMWVLGIKLRFYGRAISVLHHSPLQQVHSPAPSFRLNSLLPPLWKRQSVYHLA